MHDNELEILTHYGITDPVGLLVTYFDDDTRKKVFFALERGMDQYKRYEGDGDWSFDNQLGIPDNILDGFVSVMDHRTVKGESVLFYPYNTAMSGEGVMFLLALCEIIDLTVTIIPKKYSEYGHDTWVIELKRPTEDYSL